LVIVLGVTNAFLGGYHEMNARYDEQARIAAQRRETKVIQRYTVNPWADEEHQ